jgi:non-specific serine/threonine protein kinase
MPLLTLANLDPSYLPIFDYSSIRNGNMLANENRVTITQFDGHSAVCKVNDKQTDFIVSLAAETDYRTSANCQCTQSAKFHYCRHIVASMAALRAFISTDAIHQWKYRLQLALENTPKAKKTSSKRNKYLVLFGLRGEKYPGGTMSYRLIPYRVKSQSWDGVRSIEEISIREEQNKMLDQDRSWMRAVETINTNLDHRAVVNLSLEGVHLYNIMMRMGGYYYSLSDFSTFLPILSKIEAPVFLLSSKEKFMQRLRVLSEPVRVEAALAREGKDFSLQAGLTLNGETFTTIKGTMHILSDNPAWVLAGSYIVPLENPEAINLMQFLPLQIPGKDEEEFRNKFLQPILERIPIKGNVVSWQDVEANPQPRLYLRDEDGVLRAALRFGYSEQELEANPKADAVVVKDIPGSWGMLRIHRQLEQEEQYYQMLTDARYGLKRAGSAFSPGMFELRARTHPLDFLLHSIPLLAKAGFEVYGEENLKSGKLNRNRPTISLNITSGVDWFDVKATAHYGDQEVSLHDIRRALRKQERFIKLADGSIGQIPEEWLNKYKKLFDLAEETGEGLRVRDYHLPLVDTLLADADLSQIPEDFNRRRAFLKQFDKIKPQPVPQGFTGELRPYQKAGLDWLHFLNEYGFGGCLADDMGLGKTIQALVFLQSLKEQGKRKTAALLVVPKSLIANWQRESERFTPGLRILEFVGNTRKKDISIFDQYDIILTTYGTMLRDIEFLRGYQFDYAILDESQNIKNPLAQSSKAARLLNASHRLVMTGTPVENNTFELWSQFAFLNPGLLGSIEYFKREFATPIESRASEESALLLRKLVYPFILRRTKKQVAPELPERTERVIYTDFEAPQRKIYNQTRDYYRGMLLGMIEKDGINDVRMKILEGLLRLRQVCIHPSLIDPNYRGEAAKFEVLLNTLETLQAEGHKALIFSQFVQSLQLLRKELDQRAIRYTYLDGQTAHRQKQVDAFQNDASIPFFLISLKAGGVGLNLTAADYVIHLDPWWNPAVEMQAADRAHRIGQDKPVFVYKIITRGTVEEKILQLQEHKKELVDQIISAEGSFFKAITKEDVKVLFS